MDFLNAAGIDAEICTYLAELDDRVMVLAALQARLGTRIYAGEIRRLLQRLRAEVERIWQELDADGSCRTEIARRALEHGEESATAFFSHRLME